MNGTGGFGVDIGFSRRWLKNSRHKEKTSPDDGRTRLSADPRTSVVNAECRSWDIPNPWICDGSAFPTIGRVNPSLTIQAIACRTADRIGVLAGRGEL
ncbi:MAG: GMC family oxidoreductase [Halothiobacillus sp.]|nr:GMC family oxidoreductase [Halothiobacillus sp.]